MLKHVKKRTVRNCNEKQFNLQKVRRTEDKYRKENNLHQQTKKVRTTCSIFLSDFLIFNVMQKIIQIREILRFLLHCLGCRNRKSSK